MNELHFTTELDEQNRISVPAEVAREIPPDSTIEVRINIQSPKRLGRNTGALEYYMQHPLEIPGILPFDRDSLYDRSI
ncbi:MAG TPA: hypothetical protein VFH95_16005 [Candidatus Kapabacteria bacterium]|nr:hypothetical protein [Candidatus Kapabacteria bacterium]